MASSAIILAAGKGTRMKSELPKVLCAANGKPLIRYVIESLQQAGVQQLMIVVGYRADAVQKELEDLNHVSYCLQTEQLGTGHAVMMCQDQLKSIKGPVVVVAGDSPMLQSESIFRLLSEFEQSKAACVLGTLIHPNPVGLGRIVRDSNGNFQKIVEEKDATPEQRAINEVNMSTYVFDSQALQVSLKSLTNQNQQHEYYITDLPGIMLAQGLGVRALPVLQPIEALSVNTVEQLADVERELKRLGK